MSRRIIEHCIMCFLLLFSSPAFGQHVLRSGRIRCIRVGDHLVAEHITRNIRHSRSGHRGSDSRLHDADRAHQLAIRSDCHSRLLHSVRRVQHSCRHSFDRGARSMTALERDTLFVALTRPQMFAGVTYSLFVANVVVGTELFLIFKSIWTVALVLLLHAIAALLCLREPRFFDLWLARVSKCPRIKNYPVWQCNSYRP